MRIPLAKALAGFGLSVSLVPLFALSERPWVGRTLDAAASALGSSSRTRALLHFGGEAVDLDGLERQLSALDQRLRNQRVGLIWNDSPVLHATWAELGLGLDSAETRRRARLVLKQGGTWPPSSAGWNERHQPVELEPVLHFDRQQFETQLLVLKEQLDVPAAPARYDWSAAVALPPVAGRYLDLDRVWEQARQAALTGSDQLALTLSQLSPSRASLELGHFHPTERLGSYRTNFKRNGQDAPRAQNIELAASALDGTVLLPGQLMSFNDLVGKRSPEQGFKESWQIYKGEMVRGVGGGTCQVSSTLHAAALYAGLEIVDRFPHSRALAYIPVGLDSTVAWPAVDLKIRNSWSFPVALRAGVEGNTLIVDVMAEQKAGRVSVQRRTLEVIPFERQVEVKRYFGPTRIKLQQKGVPGYRVQRTRKIELAEGGERRERRTDYYPPTPELYQIGCEVDPQRDLPPLPEPGPHDDA